MTAATPQQQLNQFLAKYEPAVARQASEAIRVMRGRFPGAVELIYDNYNALAVGWGPSERSSDVICSIAVYPRWVSLFFFQGTRLDDPGELLKGGGSRVRHLVLEDAGTLDAPGVKALITQAIRIHPVKLDRKAPGRTIVKSVSARQRPRRPGRKTS